jgi:streptogramin lyase
MIKKIFLFVFAVVIILQAAAVSGWNSWLRGQFKVNDMNYLDGSSSYDLLVDRQNQVWVSYLDAIRVYQNGELKNTFTGQDLSMQPGHLEIDPQGQVWLFAAKSTDGMSVYDGKKLTHLKGAGDFFTWDAIVDSKGRAWLGADNGLHVYDNGKWKEFNTSNSPLPGDSVNLLAADQQGQVWTVSEQGLAVTDGVKWKTFEDSPLNGKTITDLDVDQNGHVWVAASDGLYFFNGSQWTVYTPANSGMESAEVDQLAVDQQNRVWFAGSEWGKTITVFDGKKWMYLYGEGYWSGIDAEPDGNIYLDNNGIRKVTAADTRLVNLFEKNLLGVVDYGVFIYLTILLIGIWLTFALNSRGIGIGLLGGLAIYLIAAVAIKLESGSGALGMITTVGGILGGLVGYFFKRSGKKNADLWGGAIGCTATFLITGTCMAVFLGLVFLTMQ